MTTRREPTTAPLLAALVFLVALNLRPAIVAVGPLLSTIGADLQWGESLQGLLAALPLLAFALFSPLVRLVTARFDADRIVLAALLVLAGGCLMRSALGATGVWVGTVVIGGAIAVGNVLVPVIVKRDYSKHVSTATGIYSACITSGSAIAGLSSAALADALSGWQEALAFWAVPPLVVAALWIMRTRRRTAHTPASANASEAAPTLHSDAHTDRQPRTPLWRKPVTWWVTLMMGLQSASFYTLSSWLPAIAESTGFSSAEAGVQLFLFQAIGIVSGLLIPRLMHVRGNQVCAGLAASAPMVVAGLGWLFAPHLSYIWSVIGGIGQGAALVVALTLISLRGTTQAETVALSGIAQSIGYLLSSIGPAAFGALAEVTGGFSASLVLLVALATAQCLAAVPAGKVPR